MARMAVPSVFADYNRQFEGEAALQMRDTPRAVKLFTEANALLDTWIGRLA
jgi:hypothetical protein